MRPKINALIFDIGNVLLPYDYARARNRLLNGKNKSAPSAGKNSLSAEVEELFAQTYLQYESGTIGRAQFLSILKQAFQYQGSDESLIEIWCDIFEENTPLHLQIPHLAATYPLYLLSNIGCIHREFIHKCYPVFAHFKGGVYSYEVGVMKPNPRIYQIASKQFGLLPAETLFIDDLSENVEAARAAGFQVFTYDWRQPNLFTAALSSYNLLPARPSENAPAAR